MAANSTEGTTGRFGNHVFRNLACHFIAEKFNIKFKYSYVRDMQLLGLQLFHNGINQPLASTTPIHLHDRTFFSLLTESNDKFPLIERRPLMTHALFAQTPVFARYVRDYFIEIQDDIKRANQFSTRYNNNNDVYLHVRLGDIAKLPVCLTFEYYDAAMQEILKKHAVQHVYISSDSIEHPICTKLITKYNMQIVRKNEVDTIKFASTCRHVVLSTGTFSWLIGALAFDSDVYYPQHPRVNWWHGNIFVFEDWHVL